MNLSTFLKIMYSTLGYNTSICEFVIDFFKNVIKNNVLNPFDDYEFNTIYKIYYGYMLLPKKRALQIYDNVDLEKFYGYLSNYSYSQHDRLIEEFKKNGIIISDSEMFEELGELFRTIIKNIYNKETKNIKPNSLSISPKSNNLSFENNSIYSNNYCIGTIESLNYNLSQSVTDNLLLIFSSASKKLDKQYTSIAALPKRIFIVLSNFLKCFSFASNLKAFLAKKFTNGEKEFKNFEREMLLYLSSLQPIHEDNRYKSFLVILNQIKSMNVTSTKLINIKNLITDDLKTGIFFMLLNQEDFNILSIC